MELDLSKPVPETQPWSKAFWEGAKRGKLLVQVCKNCDARIFYPRKLCPDCWSSSLDWIEASGKATVYTFSTAYSMVEPKFLDDLPYTIAYVDLDEGVRMMTRIVECAPEEIRFVIPQLGVALQLFPGQPEPRVRFGQLRLQLARIQLHQQVARPHRLTLLERDGNDRAGNLRTHVHRFVGRQRPDQGCRKPRPPTSPTGGSQLDRYSRRHRHFGHFGHFGHVGHLGRLGHFGRLGHLGNLHDRRRRGGGCCLDRARRDVSLNRAQGRSRRGASQCRFRHDRHWCRFRVRGHRLGAHADVDGVQASDNVVVTDGGPRNLTREHLAD